MCETGCVSPRIIPCLTDVCETLDGFLKMGAVVHGTDSRVQAVANLRNVYRSFKEHNLSFIYLLSSICTNKSIRFLWRERGTKHDLDTMPEEESKGLEVKRSSYYLDTPSSGRQDMSNPSKFVKQNYTSWRRTLDTWRKSYGRTSSCNGCCTTSWGGV